MTNTKRPAIKTKVLAWQLAWQDQNTQRMTSNKMDDVKNQIMIDELLAEELQEKEYRKYAIESNKGSVQPNNNSSMSKVPNKSTRRYDQQAIVRKLNERLQNRNGR